jgi:cytochrome c oxidase subunit II
MRRVSALFVAACSGRAPTPSPIVQVPADAPPDLAIDAPPDAPAIDPVLRDRGAQLFQDKGCIACHSLDGTFRIGPNLLGDWGNTVTLDDGAEVLVDEAYVRESIINSLAKKRAGFVPVMPAFEGRITPDELDALVVFIKSLH